MRVVPLWSKRIARLATTKLQTDLRCSARLLRPLSADQVDEEAIRARHSIRQLPEERQTGVDVRSFAEVCINQSAIQVRLAGIVHCQQRRVLGIELRPEIEAAFLHPALEILLRDLIWRVEQWIVRL